MNLTDFAQTEMRNISLIKLTFQAEKLLKANTDILVMGASGTGKSTWAKKLAFRKSPNSAYVLESRQFNFEEFFSHTASGVEETVILEEVDRLNFSDQTKLLLWLDNPSRKTKAIFTSSCNLYELVKKQNFRTDLYFRITVATLKLPEIKEIREDISSVAQHMVGVYGILHNRPGMKLSQGSIKKLSEWHWPGNFSELENVIEKAVLLSEDETIQENEIEISLSDMADTGTTLPIKKLSEVERDLILQTLKVTDQNRTRAAEILGISIRTLRNKIQEYREEGLI